MCLLRLVRYSPVGKGLGGWAAFLSAAVVAALSLLTALILHGAGASLDLTLTRLGADIVVVGRGAEGHLESSLVLGAPLRVWLPQAHLERIAAIPEVAAVSPQLYLSALPEPSGRVAREVFLVACDPATDLSLRPWLAEDLVGRLRPKEAVGGSNVSVPAGKEGIRLYGSLIALRANLPPTGTNLDHTLFFSFQTAYDIAANSYRLAEQPLVIPPNSISAALVKVRPEADPHQVALEIRRSVPGVTPIERADLLPTFRGRIADLRRRMRATSYPTLALLPPLLGLILTLTAQERWPKVAGLRALGATGHDVLRCLLAEAALLALQGAMLGTALAVLATRLLRERIAAALKIPLLFPPLPSLLASVAGGAALALAAVVAAALLPAWRLSRQATRPATQGRPQ